MKKLLSLLILPSLLLFNANAQNNDLVIFAEEATPFYLVMNGIKQNDNTETNVKIANVKTTRNSLKIIFEDQTIPALSKTVYMDTMNHQFTYRIFMTKKKGYKLKLFDVTAKANVPQNNNQTTVIYRTVEAPPPTKTVVKETVTTTNKNNSGDNANINVNAGESSFNMSVNVNDNSGSNNQPTSNNSESASFNMSVNVNEGTGTSQTSNNSENVNINMNVNVNDDMDYEDNASMNMNMNVNDNMDYEDNVNMNMNVSGDLDNAETTSYSSSSTTTTTTTTTSWGDDTYSESTTTTTNSGFGNDDSDFGNTSSSNSSSGCEVQNMNSILNAIENESFKSDKMMIAQQSTKKKCLSVNQIKMVMDKFTYEDSKLEFAKMAYVNCPNKDDYYQINEAFTYASSKRDLNEFINNQ